MSTFPSVLDSYTDPLSTQRLNAPSHSAIETAQNDGLTQTQAVVGVEGDSSVVGTLQYLIKSPASNGGGHVQTAIKGGTGQTTFTKGDIFVAQSSSVLSKLAIGADGTALIADSAQATGLKYGTIGLITVTSFVGTSSSWFRPSAVSMVRVDMWGGGASGGSRAGAGGAVGGGGGAYNTVIYPASALPTAVSVIAGASVIGVDGSNNGTDGNNSNFGTLLVAPGGKAGLTVATVTSLGADGGAVLNTPLARGIYGHAGSTYGVIDAEPALYSGGSGGYNNSPDVGNGGTVLYGGSGGATIASVNGSRIIGTPGTTYLGGRGGSSSILNSGSVLGLPGSVAGGGGGAGNGTVSGSGAHGKVLIYTW